MKLVITKCRGVTAMMMIGLLIQGCASNETDRSEFFQMETLSIVPEKRDEKKEAEQISEAEAAATSEPAQRTELDFEPGPSAPEAAARPDDLGEFDTSVPDLEGEPISLSVNNLPLPVFINEVFGEKLGLSYSLSPSLQDQSDLVTLRLSEPLKPQELFRTARSVLAEYGVAVGRQDGILTFTVSEDVTIEGVPLLVSGVTLPDVPVSHRPVFQVIELETVHNGQVRPLVQGLFKGQKVEVSEDPMRNAIMLKGPVDRVAEAAEVVRFFDRPVLKGRHSLLLRPAFREIGALSQALSDVLSAEGYALGSPTGSSGSIILLPMPEMEVIVAFANNNATLRHIESWAQTLDRDYQRDIESGMFHYEVQNTSAAHLADLVRQLYGNSSSGGALGKGRLVVDEQRNVLIYRGSGRSWLELREIFLELDKQVPSVLMEVLLAEVTLNENQGMGIEWLAKSGHGRLDSTFGTLGGLGVGGNGFSYTLDSAGETRAILNAFYDSNQAVIRSSPKIMVKSGEEARIEVGNEIPILTSTRQNEFQTGGDTDVLQQFQFRKTGVVLTVQPVVQASGLVDISIDQNLSETQDAGTGSVFLPTILNRSVQTSLTLRDGGSVVLGGLISRTTSRGEQGVPWISRIPGLGRLFSTRSDNRSTTELMIMVIPYVIRDDSEAQEISERLRERIRNTEAGLTQSAGEEGQTQ